MSQYQPDEFGGDGGTTQSPQAEKSKLDELGLEISALDAGVAERLGMKGVEGVVITTVQPDSPADRAGLTSGMVIVQINRQVVKSVADVAKAAETQDADNGLLLLVRYNHGSRFVVLKP